MIHGKTALVTGGAKRLGAILCEVLASEGYNVIIHYNKSAIEAKKLVSRLQFLYQNVSIYSFQADLTDLIELEKLVQFVKEEFGSLDLLINNASIFEKLDFFNADLKKIDDFSKIHLTTTLFLSQFLLKNANFDYNEKIIINMLDARRSNDLENIINYGNYFLYSLSKHCSYLSHRYLEEEIKSKKLNCKIFGLNLGLVLPNENDIEFFSKNSVSQSDINEKVTKLQKALRVILNSHYFENSTIDI